MTREELENLYETEINQAFNENGYDLNTYINPVCVSRGFNDSKKRILIIADEKRDWLQDCWLSGNCTESNNEFDINSLMDHYENTDLSAEVCKCTTGCILYRIKKDLPEVDCLWTTLNKLDKKLFEKYSTRKEVYFCEDQNIKIVQNEIEILNPSIVVFSTGSPNNNDLTKIKYVLGQGKPFFIPYRNTIDPDGKDENVIYNVSTNGQKRTVMRCYSGLFKVSNLIKVLR